MGIEYRPDGNFSGQPEAQIEPPEAYLILRALDWVKARSTDQNRVRLAICVQTETPTESLRRRYAFTAAQEIGTGTIGNDSATEQFWIGRVISYAELRPLLQRIVNSIVPGLEQRQLRTLTVKLLPQLRGIEDSITGLAAWVVAGRG